MPSWYADRQFYVLLYMKLLHYVVPQIIKKEVVLLSVVSKLHAARMKHRINGFLFMVVICATVGIFTVCCSCFLWCWNASYRSSFCHVKIIRKIRNGVWLKRVCIGNDLRQLWALQQVFDKSKLSYSNGGFLSLTLCRVIMFVTAFRRNVLPLSSWWFNFVQLHSEASTRTFWMSA